MLAPTPVRTPALGFVFVIGLVACPDVPVVFVFPDVPVFPPVVLVCAHTLESAAAEATAITLSNVEFISVPSFDFCLFPGEIVLRNDSSHPLFDR